MVHVRCWRPRRRLVSKRETRHGVHVARLSLPFVIEGMFGRAWHRFNHHMLAHVGPRTLGPLPQIDVVHSVGAMLTGTAGGHWAMRLGAAHVVQLITELDWQLAEYPRLARMHRSVHAVSCNSEYIARTAREVFPSPSDVRCIYRGTDLELFHPQGAPPPGASMTFLYLGGFPRYPGRTDGDNVKGGKTLLAAWHREESRLAKHDARLVISGPRVPNAAIKAWRDELREPDRIELRPTLSPSEVPAAMRSADVVLVPSMHDGLPNVAVEASSCGRPVLGSTAGGIPEIVDHDVTGVLTAPGDSAALGDAMVQMAGARERTAEMGRQARVRAEAHFDSATTADKFIGLYRDARAVLRAN